MRIIKFGKNKFAFKAKESLEELDIHFSQKREIVLAYISGTILNVPLVIEIRTYGGVRTHANETN
jgi:hypothetical protein